MNATGIPIAALLALLVAVVFNPTVASTTPRALLSTEFALGVSDATGLASGPDSSSLVINSEAASGATNTGDFHDAYSEADSSVSLDAYEMDSDSNSYADAYVDEPLDAIPYDVGSVSSGGVASGSDYAGTDANAYVQVVESFEGLAEASMGTTTASGSSGAAAEGYGSMVDSYVGAGGESRTVGFMTNNMVGAGFPDCYWLYDLWVCPNGDELEGDNVIDYIIPYIAGERYAMADATATGYTEASAQGDDIAATQSGIGLMTTALVNPVTLASDTSIAVIDAWSQGYGDYSETMTNTMLNAGAGFSKDIDALEGVVRADAEGGATAVFNTESSASGAEYTTSGAMGNTQSNSLANSMIQLSEEYPFAVGIGSTSAQANGNGQVYAGGETTETQGFLAAFTFADSDADAKRFGQFSFSNDVSGVDSALSGAATSNVVATGHGSGKDASVIDFIGSAASFSDEKAAVDGTSTVRNSAAAEGSVITVADFADNALSGFGMATAASGAYSNLEEEGTVGVADSEGYGQASSSSFGVIPGVGYASNYVSVGGIANTDTDSKLDGVTTTGTATGRGTGTAAGEFARANADFGSSAESVATAESIADLDAMIGTGLSVTATEGSIAQMNSIMANNIDLYFEKLDPAAPAVAGGQSTVTSTSDAESYIPDFTNGNTFGSSSESITEGSSFAVGDGSGVMGSGSLITSTTSETISGAAAGGEDMFKDPTLIEFASALGGGVGTSDAELMTSSYDYVAKGGDVGEVVVLMSGGSIANSAVETGALAVESDMDGFKLAVAMTRNANAEGFGEGYGSVGIEYTPGSSFDADNTLYIYGDGQANVGGGATSLVNDGIGSRYGLAAADSTGEGSGVGEGSTTTSQSFFDNPGEVSLEGLASGAGDATSQGLSTEIVSDFTIGTGQLAGGTASGSSSVGVFSLGGESNLVAETFSNGLTEGGAGIGEMATDPSLDFPSDASAGAYESGSSLITKAAAMQPNQDNTASAVTEAESSAAGNILIQAQPGATEVELRPELNYASSDGVALGFGSGAMTQVAAMTDSVSMSDILSPGDETTYVQITMDGDEKILTGGYSGGESLGFGFSEADAAASNAASIYDGFTRAEAESLALALAAGTTTAFGVLSASQDPSTDFDTVGGAFNGAYGKGVGYADATANAIYMKDTGLDFVFATDVTDSFSTTPSVDVVAGAAGELQIMGSDANADASSLAIAGPGDIVSLSDTMASTDAYAQVGMESVAGAFVVDAFQYVGDAMALEDVASSAAAGAAVAGN